MYVNKHDIVPLKSFVRSHLTQIEMENFYNMVLVFEWVWVFMWVLYRSPSGVLLLCIVVSLWLREC